MQYHQYSKLFTSGLLSDPSPPPLVPGPRLRRGRTLFLNPTDPELPEQPDFRTYSFLELADPIASPVSPTDPTFPWRSLGHHAISAAASPTPIGKPEPPRMSESVINPTAFSSASPLDSLPQLSIVSAGRSFLITDPPLPDSPTLDRRPSFKTTVSISASSASLSVNSETKRMNRSVALACLEGRECSSGRTPRKSQLNFMNMSDDEDEDDSFADRVAIQRSSTITASDLSVLAILSSGGREASLSPDPLVSQSQQQPKIAPTGNRPQSQTMESWFSPLSSLVDLRNEEDSPKWRSFIEFSTPAA